MQRGHERAERVVNGAAELSESLRIVLDEPEYALMVVYTNGATILNRARECR